MGRPNHRNRVASVRVRVKCRTPGSRSMRVVVAWLGISMADAAWGACPTPGPDLTVCAASCTHTTLAAAVSAAVTNDVICVDPGIYNGQIVANNKHVRVESSNPGV